MSYYNLSSYICDNRASETLSSQNYETEVFYDISYPYTHIGEKIIIQDN